jgi:AIR synthase related protein, C-terminal domain
MTTNTAGRDGDLLVLSKPLGVGAIVTARKRGHRSDELLEEAVQTMVELNDRAAEAALAAGVRAMTDITGFGLLGHLHNLCLASGLAADVYAADVPAIPGAQPLLESDIGVSSGTRGNLQWAADFAQIDSAVEPWRARLLADATTSGGLLAARGANPRDLDRARLRPAANPVRAAAVGDRRARSRAVRPHDGLGCYRDRHVPDGDRRRRRRDAANDRARPDPPGTRRAARRCRGEQERSDRPRARDPRSRKALARL